jgi:hypothetical protein
VLPARKSDNLKAICKQTDYKMVDSIRPPTLWVSTARYKTALLYIAYAHSENIKEIKITLDYQGIDWRTILI